MGEGSRTHPCANYICFTFVYFFVKLFKDPPFLSSKFFHPFKICVKISLDPPFSRGFLKCSLRRVKKISLVENVIWSPVGLSTEWSIIIKNVKKKLYYYSCLGVNIILCCELCNILGCELWIWMTVWIVKMDIFKLWIVNLKIWSCEFVNWTPLFTPRFLGWHGSQYTCS